MSVSVELNKKRVQGDGVTTLISFTFKVVLASDLVVKKILRSDDTDFTILTSPTDYSVSLDSDGEGGSITLTSAPSSLYDILIVNDPSITQPTNLPTESDFPETAVENALDRLCLIGLKLYESIARSFKFTIESDTSTIENEISLADFKGKLFGFDSVTGEPTPITYNEITGIPSAGSMAVQNADNVNIDGGTIDGVTITNPKIVGSLKDANGNEVLNITATASAVNELTLGNAATGNSPYLSASGNDTNIDIYLAPKGTGVVKPSSPIDSSAPQSIASATTTDISVATSNQVVITGTTTITGFGTTNKNCIRYITFSGALTLTHNATSLILPTGANITTVAGDTCVAVSNNSGNWTIINYQRKNGAALAQLAQSLGTNGYVTLAGGFTFQWGVTSQTTSTTRSVTFPVAFSSACYGAHAMCGDLTTGTQAESYVSSLSTTGFTINDQSGDNVRFYWFAYGQ